MEFTISAIDENTDVVGDFVKVRAQIENDYQDPVTLNTPENLPFLFLKTTIHPFSILIRPTQILILCFLTEQITTTLQFPEHRFSIALVDPMLNFSESMKMALFF